MSDLIINLGNTTRAKIVRAIIGQLSDGKWENSPAMYKYWRYANVKGTDLEISMTYGSGFLGRDEEWIKNWFASKLKAVVKDEVGNTKSGWSRDNLAISDYISYHNDISVAECYECYDFLKGRKAQKYAFQIPDYTPELQELAKCIKKSILAFADAEDLIITSAFNDWIENLFTYFEPHFKHILNNKVYDKKYIENLEQYNDKFDISWPNITESAIILEKALKAKSNYYYEITSNNGYSMTPDDCFKALYYYGEGYYSLKDIIFIAIYNFFDEYFIYRL